MKSLSAQHQQWKSIGFMIAAMLFFSLMNNCIREASTLTHSTQLVLWRNVFIVAIMGIWILTFHSVQQFKTSFWKRHFLRASLGILAMQLWFYALSVMPINEATALSFTAPIFASFFAIIWLKETSNPWRWFSVIIGFIGTLIILNPNASAFGLDAMAVILSAAIMGISSIIIKVLTRTDHVDTIVFYQGAMMLPLSIPFAIPFFVAPTGEVIMWSFVIALCAVIAHLFMTRAFALGEMVVLAPFDFTRLIFTAIIAYYWFDEILMGNTVLGGLLIVAGSAIATAASNPKIKQKLRRLFAIYRG